MASRLFFINMNKGKRKALFLSLLTTSAIAMAVSLINQELAKVSFALFSSSGDGTWVHYEQAMPGTINGTSNGVREYWIQCGGGKSSIRFVDPGVSYQEGCTHDVSEFEVNDSRWIINVDEQEGEYKSIIHSNVNNVTYFNEISGMSNGFTTNDELPSLGENKKILWVKDDNNPAYYANTLTVTKVISTKQDFIDLFKCNNSSTFAENEYVDGYYVLADDVSVASGNMAGYLTPGSESITTNRGFKGVFDGRGHSITNPTNSYYNCGVFGILNGATIKNVNFTTVRFANYSASIIGVAHDSILKNIHVDVLSVSESNNNVYNGRILFKWSTNNLIEDINVNINAGVNLLNLFGGYSNGSNTFINVVAKADNVPYLATLSSESTSVNDKRGLTFIPNSATYIDIDRQDISVNDNSALSVSTGSVNVGTISSIDITQNGTTYNFGNDINNLVVPNELKNSPMNHGDGTLIITNTFSVTYALKVTLVTRFISQNSDLAYIRGSNLGAAIYGYFAMTNNITVDYSDGGIGKTTQPSWDTTGGGNGFYGIFDGRGFKLSGNIFASQQSVFGALRGTGTVNNLSLDALNHYSGYGFGILSSRPSGVNINQFVSFNNINIRYTIAGDNTNRTAQLVMGYVYVTSFKNVNVTVEGTYPKSSTVSLLPANYPTGRVLFNHVTWNTPANSNTHLFDGTDAYDNLITINTPEFIIEESINIDKSQSTYTFNLDNSVAVNSVFWNDNQIATSKTINTSIFGNYLGKSGDVVVYGTKNGKDIIATYHITLCTKVIKTQNDLDTFLSVADAVNGVVDDQIYDGYFVLDNDIEYAGTHEPQMQDVENKAGQQEYGFRGIFDGQNHVINNFSIRSTLNDAAYNRVIGLISRLHKNGIVRNLGFTNATVGNCALVVGWGEGTCENIYVHYATQTPWSAYFGTFNNTISGPTYGEVTVKNCIIDASNLTKGSAKKIVGDSWDNAYSYKGVYCLLPNGDFPTIRRATDAEEYISDEDSAKGKEVNKSLMYDVVNGYTSYSDMFRECGDDIDSWESFTYQNNNLYFGDKLITTAAPSSLSTHNFIDDYTVVCDLDDINSVKAANLIVNHLYRAGSTVSYYPVTNSYRYAKRYSGGIVINKVGKVSYASNKNLIVVGNKELENQLSISTSECKITTIDNSVFISANESKDLLAASIEYLSRAIGYKALGDDLFYYDTIPSALPTINDSFKVSFSARGRVNHLESFAYDSLGFNGVMTVDEFIDGPTLPNGNKQIIHNSTQWLPESTYQSSHPNWYWQNSNGTYDICYTAHGNSSELTAMINETASLMRQVFINNPACDKLTFSLQDTSYTNCTCSACNSANSTYGDYGSGAAINFLNKVAERIVALDAAEGINNRDFTIYLLSYYYFSPAPNGIAMNDHVGVMIAPMNDEYVYNAYEALSIYDSKNDNMRQAIEKWCSLTDNVTFWYYCQIYNNYFCPFDNYETTLTWLEHIAYLTNGACKQAYVQGQSTYTQTSFQSYKQYMYSRAMIEITEKVNPKSSYGSIDLYNAAIKNYSSELENEFFSITSRTSTTLTSSNIDSEVNNYTFADGGYFGTATANKNMFLLYAYQRIVYRNLLTTGAKHNNNSKTMYGSCSEFYSFLVTSNYKACGSGITYANIHTFLDNASSKTYYYCANFKSSDLTKEMGYYEAAIASLTNYNHPAVDVYRRHVLLESLSPRFFICMANSSKSGYGFYDGYNGTSLSNMRSSFKNDCESLYFTKLSESVLITKLFTKWGI